MYGYGYGNGQMQYDTNLFFFSGSRTTTSGTFHCDGKRENGDKCWETQRGENGGKPGKGWSSVEVGGVQLDFCTNTSCQRKYQKRLREKEASQQQQQQQQQLLQVDSKDNAFAQWLQSSGTLRQLHDQFRKAQASHQCADGECERPSKEQSGLTAEDIEFMKQFK